MSEIIKLQTSASKTSQPTTPTKTTTAAPSAPPTATATAAPPIKIPATTTTTLKQQRLLTRTAELDSDSTDADLVLFEQNLKLKDAAAASTSTSVTAPAAAAAANVVNSLDDIPTTTTTTTTSTTATTNNSSAASSSGTAILEQNKKPFKIKDVTRNIRKSLVVGSLAEMRPKAAEKFNRSLDHLPNIHLDCDGTEIDDEEYFRTLEDNTELIAVFPGQQWLDPMAYTALALDHERNSRRSSLDTKNLRKLVGKLQGNYLNDTDLDSLSNMDPNSLVDITGKELIEQMRDSDYYLQSEAFRTELSC